MQSTGIMAVALVLSSPAAARASSWTVDHCVISKTASDGAAWSLRRHGQGALLTVTKPHWTLPKGETLDVYLYFGGGGFGHYRPATAHRVRGKPSLTFDLGDELLLAFRGFRGVLITSGGEQGLTDWLDLEGSSRAYSKLAQC